MIQIFHEAPLQIFDKVKEVTDGEYALVHLLDNDLSYAKAMATSRANSSRPFILDNSAYELGKAFSAGAFAEWIGLINPSTYVVPDVIGDSHNTVEAFSQWKTRYRDLDGKKMGVVQGNTFAEVTTCFKALQMLGADIIGIPFLIGRGVYQAQNIEPTPFDLMNYRIRLLKHLVANCEKHPIHLLGVALPQEGIYVRGCSWIESIDTSNPVIHGLAGIAYDTEKGLSTKRSELLADLIHTEVTPEQEKLIFENIAAFKRFFTRA